MIGTLLSGRFRLEEKMARRHVHGLPRVRRDARALGGDQDHAPEISDDPQQIERFRREPARGRLSNPHVVTVIDAGRTRLPYIVFEYVAGETLKERIKRVGRLPVTERWLTRSRSDGAPGRHAPASYTAT